MLYELDMGRMAVSQRDVAALARRYRKKTHALWDDAEEAVASL